MTWETIATKKAVDELYKLVTGLIKNRKLDVLKRVTIASTAIELEKAISSHLNEVISWSDKITFRDLINAKRTTDIYIELDLYLIPINIGLPSEKIEKQPLNELVFSNTEHAVILGQPGSGKTTSMKKICQEMFIESSSSNTFKVPILVRLRDIKKRTDDKNEPLIFEHLFDLLGFEIDISNPITKPEDLEKEQKYSEINKIKQEVVISTLENLGVLLILDGFDELPDHFAKQLVLQDIRKLCMLLSGQSKVIITSRSGDFGYEINGARNFEISPLSKSQVTEFANNWICDQNESNLFVERIFNTPYADTTIRPLTLAHLCAIYLRTKTIPKKPKTVYKKIINLLLEEWDEQRSVVRESRYADFEVDRKFEFLARFAYELSTDLRQANFNINELLFIYDKIYRDFELSKDQGRKVARELESHSGLILQAGSDVVNRFVTPQLSYFFHLH